MIRASLAKKSLGVHTRKKLSPPLRCIDVSAISAEMMTEERLDELALLLRRHCHNLLLRLKISLELILNLFLMTISRCSSVLLLASSKTLDL